MKQKLMDELASALRQKREALLQDGTVMLVDEQPMATERESELEESAQNDLMTRLTSHLKERDQKTIREIDAALERMAAGVYGECTLCENDIGINRLRALPTTTLCIECATARERKQQLINAVRPSSSYDPFSSQAMEKDFDAPETDG